MAKFSSAAHRRYVGLLFFTARTQLSREQAVVAEGNVVEGRLQTAAHQRRTEDRIAISKHAQQSGWGGHGSI